MQDEVQPGDGRYYDVCLSFAGEDRPYVAQVAQALRGKGVRVFYDTYEQKTLWGKDLYEHLDHVYQHAAKYCIIFISEAYSRKLWTNHERKSAQARALREGEEYVLPARFDDTELPGLRPTVGYIDLRRMSPLDLAELVAEKLADDSKQAIKPSLPEDPQIVRPS
ncbi:MAG: TIR domain-containing protein [Acidobacteria bacterium]|nr:TIR domain-containing protein [Acidobacteriota bacterium]